VTSVAAEATRRHLSARQAAVVDRLLAAAGDEVRAAGYEGISVRSVARRAGVAPATAYTYFSSKDHLLAEVLWRRLCDVPPPEFGPGQTRVERVCTVLRDTGLFMADDPGVAVAGTAALLGSGPEVMHLRDRMGADMHHRLRLALGEGADPDVLSALELAWAGAMLTAGMGHLSFTEVPDRLAVVARLILGAGQ